MLNPKQASYINMGLKDTSKGIYYWHGKEVDLVQIDTLKLKTTPIFGIKFENDEKAKYFAENYMTYDKCYFDVFAYKADVIIEPRRIDGILIINCGKNEEMAKKLEDASTEEIKELSKEQMSVGSQKED